MTKILVIHGAGMEKRGIDQTEIFGSMKLNDYNDSIKKFSADLNISVEIFRSNNEQDVIDKISDVEKSNFDGILINPAGYTKGFPKLADRISKLNIPCVEIHVSNPARRGRDSDIAPVCHGVITGAGVYGYYLGMAALKNLSKKLK